MASVCKVPTPYIFIRGQGAKLTSIVCDYCNTEGFLLPVLEPIESDDSYEGAIVLPPKTGIYFEPIVTLDFNSLYPSSMISENLSKDSYVTIGGKYDNLPDVTYSDITYDSYQYSNKKKSNGQICKKRIKTKIGTNTCRYVQPDQSGKRAIIPAILDTLLLKRKETRKMMKSVTDNFHLKVLDGRQLAFKTAVGRNMIIFSKNYVEKEYADKILTLTDEEALDDKDQPTPYANRCVHVKNSTCIYGDTDSVFIKFGLFDPITNEKIIGLDAIFLSMAIGKKVAREISKQLKRPQNLDFEKVICPYLLFRKKGYAGFYYTKMNIDSYYLNSMGIVLKRRDNAPIVKHIFGGAIKRIMEDKDIKGALEFVMTECEKVMLGEFPINNFIISKTLKSYYKMPDKIAHNVLAKRQAQRDPGNKFSPNDRVPYCYIKSNGKGINEAREENKGKMKCMDILQGNYIETPTFIMENDLKIDYTFYITNQIQKPVSQIFELEKGYDNISDVFKKLIQRVNNKMAGAKPIEFIKTNNPIVYRKMYKPIPKPDDLIESSSESNFDSDLEESNNNITVDDTDNVYNNFDNPLF